MKIKSLAFLLTVAAISVSGFAVAGPGDKGKGSVTIEHTNSSEDGEGSVEITVSQPAAVTHIDKHDGDCVVADDDDLIDDLLDCDPIVEIVE
jgi:hypothetical protein